MEVGKFIEMNSVNEAAGQENAQQAPPKSVQSDSRQTVRDMTGLQPQSGPTPTDPFQNQTSNEALKSAQIQSAENLAQKREQELAMVSKQRETYSREKMPTYAYKS